MSGIEKRGDRRAAHQERARRLPGHEGELGAHVPAASPERLLKRNPKTGARCIGAVNMATACGERTAGRGNVGYVAAPAIPDGPEAAAAVCPRMARNCNLSEPAIGMLDVTARILRLDSATRDFLFCGVGSRRLGDRGATPKRAILDALGRTTAAAVGTGIRNPPVAARHRR